MDNIMSRRAGRLTMRDMRGGTCEFLCLAEKATLRLKKTRSLIALAIGRQGQRTGETSVSSGCDRLRDRK